MSVNSVFITDENEAKSTLQKAAAIQDYGAINNAERWAEMMLSPENYVATINDAVDGMTPEAKDWYRRNYGGKLRLVQEEGGHIPAYVVRDYAGAE